MPRGRPSSKQKDGSGTAAASIGAGGAETGAAAAGAASVPSSSSSGGGAAATPAAGPYSHLDTDAALAAMGKDAESLIDPSLYRLTSGLPRHELDLMAREADEAEVALIEEIRILEKELGMKGSELTEEAAATGAADDSSAAAAAKPSGRASVPAHFSTADEMLASDLTPADQFYAVSALLGRLREPLNTPLPPNWGVNLEALPAGYSSSSSRATKKSGGGGGNGAGGGATAEQKEAERKCTETNLGRQRALLALRDNPAYTKRLDGGSNAPLLAFCKKVSNHRTSAVFRRPVNPREAPGYTERIPFPIDLSLIKKMVQAGMISSFEELHQRMGLICHNCVKYNGRESDYGLVTREFEAYMDDAMVVAVNAFGESLARSGGSSSATAAAQSKAGAAAATGRQDSKAGGAAASGDKSEGTNGG